MPSFPRLEKQRKLLDFNSDIKQRITYVKQSPEDETKKTIGVAIALLESIITDLEGDVRS
jgi:hypothetical protein